MSQMTFHGLRCLLWRSRPAGSEDFDVVTVKLLAHGRYAGIKPQVGARGITHIGDELFELGTSRRPVERSVIFDVQVPIASNVGLSTLHLEQDPRKLADVRVRHIGNGLLDSQGLEGDPDVIRLDEVFNGGLEDHHSSVRMTHEQALALEDLERRTGVVLT